MRMDEIANGAKYRVDENFGDSKFDYSLIKHFILF